MTISVSYVILRPWLSIDMQMETEVVQAGDKNAQLRAVGVLKAGGLIAFPTDTVYGVAALPWDVGAVARLYVAKQRPRDLPIPLLLSDADQLHRVATLAPVFTPLTERFWPGGLTLVLPKTEIVPTVVSPGPTVAVRVPNHPVPLALIAALGTPLAATSANLSGRPSPVTAPGVEAELGGRIELILDGGRCPGGVPSTVLDLTADPPAILRAGAIAVEEIKTLLAEKGIGICYLQD